MNYMSSYLPFTRARRLGQLLFLVGLLAGSSAATAAPWEQEVRPNHFAPTTPRNNSISVERAVRLVRKETGGRVLAATPSTRQGRSGVEVRILLDDGARVSTLFVEADGRIRRR